MNKRDNIMKIKMSTERFGLCYRFVIRVTYLFMCKKNVEKFYEKEFIVSLKEIKSD